MNDFFTAYKERMWRVHRILHDLSGELKREGMRCMANKDPLIKFILILDEDRKEHCIVGFADVPYRWYVGIKIKPSKEFGSGYTLMTDFGNELPWDAAYILKECMKPNPEGMMPLNHLREL
jgi:hypothetical protein